MMKKKQKKMKKKQNIVNKLYIYKYKLIKHYSIYNVIMNIVYDINDYSKDKFFFLETKRNTIMDGYFTKILYSNEYLTTIGIYLTVEFQGASIHLVNNKNILYFDKKSYNNNLCKKISEIEKDILEYYKILFNCKKNLVTILSDHLNNNCLKLYMKENNKSNSMNTIIKISGIWETEKDFGITYKFIEVDIL